MTVLAEAEQDQIEVGHPSQLAAIGFGRRDGAEFRRDGMNVLDRQADPVQPGRGGHAAVALGMLRRQATFVAIPDLPAPPVVALPGQGRVEPPGRAPAGEDDVELPAHREGLGLRGRHPGQGLGKPVGRILRHMPAGIQEGVSKSR